KKDLRAGLTVGILLIPQSMAYAMLAGLPPVYGLYASIIPLLIYAIFGTSRQLGVGPVAIVSILVATGVGSIAETGSTRYIQLVLALTLLVG
ncbi:MAG: sodium-independent anion transporter, partial [Aliifodinibius sp.]|nr:sodium-independent anion transporter [Fodinibius sp.]